MESGSPAPYAIVFLDFELRPGQRLLLRAGRPLAIGARAFDLLSILAFHAGDVVSNRVLIDAVWPHTVVIDANLRVQIAALRRLLGDAGSVVVNVAGRGYAFTAPTSTAVCSASIVAGLVRCTSKPAASARSTSSFCPYPVSATSRNAPAASPAGAPISARKAAARA